LQAISEYSTYDEALNVEAAAWEYSGMKDNTPDFINKGGFTYAALGIILN
jgi:hypothetical protein